MAWFGLVLVLFVCLFICLGVCFVFSLKYSINMFQGLNNEANFELSLFLPLESKRKNFGL